ncbi:MULTISPECIES: hypothetical protein [Mesonia]|uniref:Uncharacterized protein n=1 Tax=Mesonia oceanica TaxID=2687242 RepID=A0AC61Y3Y3_9FLAO|nr:MULTISPECIES: hypothetical protein [Mesonia]VVU99185.1 hypothetical protein FVB9532_00437 [Mesonia oceanica]|tara:strand:+ start:19727 stop:20290 length:564 start_codon:yes stop_codon:yes gene_type:complete
MKSSLLKSIFLVSRIILPAILCVLLILGLKQYVKYQLILIFSIIIVFFNYGKTKYNYLLSFLISIISSYLVFFISFGIYLGIGFIFQNIDLEKTGYGIIEKFIFLIMVLVVPPLLMFYCYRIIFNAEKTNYFKYIKWSSIIVLVIYGIIRFFHKDDYLFVVWQFIMVLALQLILYQKELKTLFKSKN